MTAPDAPDSSLAAIIWWEKTRTPKGTIMRNSDERQTALECLRLAISAFGGASLNPGADIVPLARDFYAFVTGADTAALAEEAKAAIDKLAR